MGGRLCLLRQSTDDRLQCDNHPSKDCRMAETGSILDFFKPSCLRLENKRQVTAVESMLEKPPKPKKLTLEEWLAASPCVIREVRNGGEVQASRQYSSRVCPWTDHPSSVKFPARFGPSSGGERARPAVEHEWMANSSVDVSPNFCKARDSICIERERRLADGNEGLVSSLSRSQCGKPKKKVSFRLPDEADICYVFYSPEDGRWE